MARHVGFGVETTYGTAVAATDFSEAVRESMQTNRNYEELTPLRTNSVRQVNELTSNVSGDVEMYGNYHDIGVLLQHFLGSSDTTGTQSPYTHTFPAAAGTTGRLGKMLTVEVQRDNAARTWRYAGCKVTGLQLSATLDQSPRLTWSFMGKSEGTGTASTASWPTFTPLKIQDMSITFSGTTMPAQSINLNASWPVDEPYQIGTGTFAKEPVDNAPLSVNADCSVIFADAEMTQYAYFDGSTDVDVAIVVTNATESMTINLNKCRITAAPVNVSERERLTGTFNLTSYYDATGTENMQVVLLNEDAVITT